MSRRKSDRLVLLCVGIILFGVGLIVAALLFTFMTGFGGWSDEQTHIVVSLISGGLVYLVLGIGVLFLKNWARVATSIARAAMPATFGYWRT